MQGIFGDPTMGALRAALDACALRHEVVAGNIANAGTPGYQAREVSFGRRVQDLRATGSGMESGVGAFQWTAGPAAEGTPWTAVVTTREGAAFNGTSFVNVSEETAHMTQNAVRYQVLAQLAAGRFHGLNTVIHEGRQG